MARKTFGQQLAAEKEKVAQLKKECAMLMSERNDAMRSIDQLEEKTKELKMLNDILKREKAATEAKLVHATDRLGKEEYLNATLKDIILGTLRLT